MSSWSYYTDLEAHEASYELYLEDRRRDDEEQEKVRASCSFNRNRSPSREVEKNHEKAFRKFFAEAWKDGIRAHHLNSWAPKVVETLSGGETKFIVLNSRCESHLLGPYTFKVFIQTKPAGGAKGYSGDLQRKITEVQREVEQGALSFDPNNEHGVLVEAALRLGKDVDTKLRAEAGGATPDLVASQYAFADPSRPKFMIKYDDATNPVVRSEGEEKKRLLRLGLDAGGSKQYGVELYYAELPLGCDWEVNTSCFKARESSSF
ncbi:hypothetical protein RQP46_008836 [Phenoliferia psychrophenolica]